MLHNRPQRTKKKKSYIEYLPGIIAVSLTPLFQLIIKKELWILLFAIIAVLVAFLLFAFYYRKKKDKEAELAAAALCALSIKEPPKISISIDRDSVCAADDCEYHKRMITLYAGTSVEEFMDILYRKYLPTIFGNNVVWLFTAENRPLCSFYTLTYHRYNWNPEAKIKDLFERGEEFYVKYYSSPEHWRNAIVNEFNSSEYGDHNEEIVYCDSFSGKPIDTHDYKWKPGKCIGQQDWTRWLKVWRMEYDILAKSEIPALMAGTPYDIAPSNCLEYYTDATGYWLSRYQERGIWTECYEHYTDEQLAEEKAHEHINGYIQNYCLKNTFTPDGHKALTKKMEDEIYAKVGL